MSDQPFELTPNDEARLRAGEPGYKIVRERSLDRIWRDYQERLKLLKI